MVRTGHQIKSSPALELPSQVGLVCVVLRALQVSSLQPPPAIVCRTSRRMAKSSAQRRMSRPLLGARKAPRGTHPHTRYESHAGRNFRPWTANNLHGGHCCYWQTCLLSLHVLCRRTYSVLAAIRHLIHLARD
ncbi:hypothetical protein M441DRAFT_441943 [Trichoderma asperellum CBS 433.97]|uniref:Uncharacterized protein n=1 Tax=Trichoderma asperellum (strain ATCC 204424 / CBS 433.97 / NBRC 101777) TaxID=1042311 RepID=A0A2T3Z4B5_TRIA4|nr:hypothetical protein M441DRAFT_441943 [Trichoderma asperellum CBS 433.97]PTB39661.1 hypothetical protein M441DRAFT_441943 [Trichoderma asperellum CBS 433.97]